MRGKIFNKCKSLKIGEVIHRTRNNREYKFIGVRDKRKGYEVVLYIIPNNKFPNHPYVKGIQKNELEKFWIELSTQGEITKKWFKTELSDCDNEGACNFTAIIGIIDKIHPNQFKKGHGKISKF